MSSQTTQSSPHHQRIPIINKEPSFAERILMFFSNGYYSETEFTREAEEAFGASGKDWAESQIKYAWYDAKHGWL